MAVCCVAAVLVQETKTWPQSKLLFDQHDAMKFYHITGHLLQNPSVTGGLPPQSVSIIEVWYFICY